MSSSKTSTLRKSLMAFMALSAVAMFAAPVASATVTTTNITANTIKAWDMADNTDGRYLPINERTISGTVDAAATAGDTVSVGCYDPITGYSLVELGLATVSAVKKWSLTESKGSKVVSIGY
ncbi:MAG: hypothetical protein NTX07_03025 [Solirubrobacterales bacterium]|nr:hypothetical protein [Solirubrobacterales bacterium]